MRKLISPTLATVVLGSVTMAVSADEGAMTAVMNNDHTLTELFHVVVTMIGAAGVVLASFMSVLEKLSRVLLDWREERRKQQRHELSIDEPEET